MLILQTFMHRFYQQVSKHRNIPEVIYRLINLDLSSDALNLCSAVVREKPLILCSAIIMIHVYPHFYLVVFAEFDIQASSISLHTVHEVLLQRKRGS